MILRRSGRSFDEPCCWRCRWSQLMCRMDEGLPQATTMGARTSSSRSLGALAATSWPNCHQAMLPLGDSSRRAELRPLADVVGRHRHQRLQGSVWRGLRIAGELSTNHDPKLSSLFTPDDGVCKRKSARRRWPADVNLDGLACASANDDG